MDRKKRMKLPVLAIIPRLNFGSMTQEAEEGGTLIRFTKTAHTEHLVEIQFRLEIQLERILSISLEPRPLIALKGRMRAGMQTCYQRLKGP